MPLAIPYLIPFANAAGIVIGSVATAVGLSALSDKVQDYMAENPEETLKILAMIMPEQGIAALFNKEAGDEGEGEEVEGEVEIEVEDKPKSKKSKKQIILEELGKEKGSYASPEAEGSWASKRGRIIRRLKEEGKITDKPDPDYDPNKPKFNWKRFTRKKADGGRIGFVEGGWADDLTGQALATYNSMKSAQHTDQTIQDTLQELGYWSPDGDAMETVESIVGTDTTQGGDGEVGVRSYVPLSERNKVTIPSLTENQLAQKALWENQKWTPQMEANKAYWENQPDVSGEEDVGFLEGLKNKVGNVWSGITGSKAGQGFNKFAFTPMMALANRYNALNPNAVNFNPMLRQQKDLALRPTTMGGLGFQQDDIGRFLGSANPENEDYNPLLGQNLVSMFGTNDLTQMLRNRLQKIRTRKIGQTESSLLKQEKIQELINQAVADESAGYTGTPGGNVGSGVFAKMDQSGKTYGPYTSQGNQGNQGGYNHPGSAKSREMSDPFNEGGLATMFERRR